MADWLTPWTDGWMADCSVGSIDGRRRYSFLFGLILRRMDPKLCRFPTVLDNERVASLPRALYTFLQAKANGNRKRRFQLIHQRPDPFTISKIGYARWADWSCERVSLSSLTLGLFCSIMIEANECCCLGWCCRLALSWQSSREIRVVVARSNWRTQSRVSLWCTFPDWSPCPPGRQQEKQAGPQRPEPRGRWDVPRRRFPLHCETYLTRPHSEPWLFQGGHFFIGNNCVSNQGLGSQVRQLTGRGTWCSGCCKRFIRWSLHAQLIQLFCFNRTRRSRNGCLFFRLPLVFRCTAIAWIGVNRPVNASSVPLGFLWFLRVVLGWGFSSADRRPPPRS